MQNQKLLEDFDREENKKLVLMLPNTSGGDDYDSEEENKNVQEKIPVKEIHANEKQPSPKNPPVKNEIKSKKKPDPIYESLAIKK